MFGTAEVAEHGFQRVADHLAPLAEGGFHHLDEQRLVAPQALRGIAAQADDGALDLRGRIENRLVDGEEIFDVVPRLQEHREDAVLLRSGRLGQPHGDLFLNHADAFGHKVAVFQHLEENLGRDVVREIADDPQPFGKAFAEVHPQEIALDQPRRELRVVCVEVGDALRVDLGSPRHYIAAAQQKLRQHAHAAPHFEHRTRRGGGSARERVANLACNVQVGEKMLPQRLFSPYFRHNSV